jgi:hypothetical protein|nr:MAG TPA: hypothetical protein [Bacteriophage sp.]
MHEENKFENSQAIQFAQAIQEAEMNFTRDAICEYLNIPTHEKHPDTGEDAYLTFEQAFGELVKAGYRLDSFVTGVDGKLVFNVQFFKLSHEKQIEICPTFNVSTQPLSKETEKRLKEIQEEQKTRGKKKEAKSEDKKEGK